MNVLHDIIYRKIQPGYYRVVYRQRETGDKCEVVMTLPEIGWRGRLAEFCFINDVVILSKTLTFAKTLPWRKQ